MEWAESNQPIRIKNSLYLGWAENIQPIRMKTAMPRRLMSRRLSPSKLTTQNIPRLSASYMLISASLQEQYQTVLTAGLNIQYHWYFLLCFFNKSNNQNCHSCTRICTSRHGFAAVGNVNSFSFPSHLHTRLTCHLPSHFLFYFLSHFLLISL